MKSVWNEFQKVVTGTVLLIASFIQLAWAWTRGLSDSILPTSDIHDPVIVFLVQCMVVVFCYSVWNWLAIVVHELGHLFAALAIRWQVESIAIFPLRLQRVGRSFRLRIYAPKRKQPHGLVKACPLNLDRWRIRTAILIASGPGANLLLGTLLLLLPLPLARAFPTFCSPEQATYWLYFAAFPQLICGVRNLIPQRGEIRNNDGRQLLSLLEKGTERERTMIPLVLGAIMVRGMRPSGWDAALVDRMLALRDGSLVDAPANHLAYYHAIDTKQWDQAGIYLDLVVAAFTQSTADIPDTILLEKAYYEAFHRRNVRARDWLTLVKKPTRIETHSRLRAEAAVSFVEGFYEEAAARAADGLAAVPQSVDRGGSLAEADWLQQFLVECKKALAS